MKWEREACSEQKLAQEELNSSAKALIKLIYQERRGFYPSFSFGLFLSLHNSLKKTTLISSDLYHKPDTN